MEKYLQTLFNCNCSFCETFQKSLWFHALQQKIILTFHFKMYVNILKLNQQIIMKFLKCFWVYQLFTVFIENLSHKEKREICEVSASNPIINLQPYYQPLI